MLDISPSGHFSFSTTTDMEFAVFGTLNAAGEGAGWNWKDARKAIVTPLSPEEPAAGAGGEAIKRYVVEVQAPSGVCLYRTVLYSGEDMGPN